MKIFSLMFAERANDSSVASSICGPYLFFSYDNALARLLEYVRGRVVDLQLDTFFSSMRDAGLDVADFEEDVAPTVVCFDRFVASLDRAGQTELANWYFDFANDECVDAFYRIDEHETGVLEDFALFVGAKVDEAADGGDVGMALSDDNLVVMANSFDPAPSLIRHA